MTFQTRGQNMHQATSAQTTPAFEINNPESYAQAMRTLSEAKRPAWILQALMNAFEAYRQSRKIGWSRPWNKAGVTTFKSYKLNFADDSDLIALASSIVGGIGSRETEVWPGSAAEFVADLLSPEPEKRRRLMGFLFYQEIEVDGRLNEAVTLSLGRVNGKRHRDRLDLIFEAPVAQNSAAPISRIRIYVDPFLGVAPPLAQAELNGAEAEAHSHALATLSDLYRDWEPTKGAVWDHWTSRYIDYFGPRRHHSIATHFLEAAPFLAAAPVDMAPGDVAPVDVAETRNAVPSGRAAR
jgi:hypothetical protein